MEMGGGRAFKFTSGNASGWFPTQDADFDGHNVPLTSAQEMASSYALLFLSDFKKRKMKIRQLLHRELGLAIHLQHSSDFLQEKRVI